MNPAAFTAPAPAITAATAAICPIPCVKPPQIGLRYCANEIDASATTITYSIRIAHPAMKLTSSLKAWRASIEEPPRSRNIDPPSA